MEYVLKSEIFYLINDKNDKNDKKYLNDKKKNSHFIIVQKLFKDSSIVRYSFHSLIFCQSKKRVRFHFLLFCI